MVGLSVCLVSLPARANYYLADECSYRTHRTRYDSYGGVYYEKCPSTLESAAKLAGTLLILGVLDEVLSSDDSKDYPLPRRVYKRRQRSRKYSSSQKCIYFAGDPTCYYEVR